MQEYRVVWQQCPYIRHASYVIFLKAESKEAAAALARDHIERSKGIEWFSIREVTEAKPTPAGEIISG